MATFHGELPNDVLHALTLGNCEPRYLAGMSKFIFPCGLRVSWELARGGTIFASQLMHVHEQHHQEDGEVNTEWWIEEVVKTGGTWLEVAFHCCHSEH